MPPNREQQERLNFVVEADHEPLKYIEGALHLNSILHQNYEVRT